VPEVITDVPLLALTEVLFPGTYLSLRLENPAQRNLIRACNDNGRQVGVVMTNDKTGHGKHAIPSTIGCLASIAMLIHEGDDEETPASVILYGERRIRVLSLIQQDPFLTGSVGLVDETPGSNVGRRLLEATEQFAEYRKTFSQRIETDVAVSYLPDDPTVASYTLASVLPVPLNIKQRWLEVKSSAHRLAEETAYMCAECELHNIFFTLAQSQRHRYTRTIPQSFYHLLADN